MPFDVIREGIRSRMQDLRNSILNPWEFLEGFPVQAWVLSSPDTYLVSNSLHAEFLGVDVRRLQGSSIAEFMTDRDSAQLRIERNTALFSSGVPSEDVVPVNGSDGSLHRLRVTKRPLLDADGRVQALVCTVMGTETGDGYCRMVVENCHDGVFVLRDGSIEFTNRAMCEITGLPEGSIEGMTLEALVHPEDRACLRLHLESVTAGDGSPVRFTARVQTPGGGLRYLEFSLCVHDSDDDPCCVGVVRDVTRQKETREKLRNLRIQMLRMERVNSLGLLAGGISDCLHDVISAMKSVIDRAASGGSTDGCLEDASTSCRRARRLVEQLLSFSNRREMARRITDIRPIIRESASFALSGESTYCSFRLEGDLKPVNVDPEAISRVIHSLVSNAENSMGSRGEILVRVENVPAGKEPSRLPPGGNGYVRISIRDSGSGIAQDDLPRIFEPFYRMDSSGGLGLGLSMACSIIECHDGFIDVSSELGVGSVFSIYLPAAGISQRSGIGTSCRVPGPRRILLLEDDEDSETLAVEMLEWLGFQVKSVRDSSSAENAFSLAMGEDVGFEAVIMDSSVPDSLATGSRIRRMSHDTDLILTTDDGTLPDRDEPETNVFSSILRKPLDINRLRQVLSPSGRKQD